MRLRRRQRLMLARAEMAIGQADARLAGMFAAFNSLAAGESMPAAEQLSRRAEIRRWAGRRSSVPVIAAIAALLAGLTVIAAGLGPVCGRCTAAAGQPAAQARGCLFPAACPVAPAARWHRETGRNRGSSGSDVRSLSTGW